MEYITTKEASAKWGISTSRITILANEGRIPGAQRFGRSWLIPFSAPKPPELKPDHSGSVRKQAKSFSLPLYLFRPDWSSAKEAQLSKQQRSLLLAEKAVLECRFAEAYELLQSIMSAPADKVTEIGCLWNAGLCCVALNKPQSFSRIFMRLQMLLAEDFPHRDDLIITIDILKTYVESIGSAANNADYNTDIHDQCLPLTCLKAGYMNLTKEAVKSNSADTTLLELNLRFLKNTSAVIAVAMMHMHLLGIYCLRQDMTAAEKHAKAAVQLVFESKLYFPLVTYYRYFTSVLAPILAQYPEEFQEHCHELIAQYEKNFSDFYSSINEYSVISKLTDEDYPYIYAVLKGQHNASIAEKLGLHPQTIQSRLAKLCKKFGVTTKKELRDYLLRYM